MKRGIPLAWRQLTWEKRRLGAALAGISFAVILMLMQLGFKDALLTSATALHTRFETDLFLISPRYEFLINPQAFTARRLYQALAVDGVDSVVPIFLGQALFKNPETLKERRVLLIGFEPQPHVLNIPGVEENLEKMRATDVVLFDARSRPEFGRIAEDFKREGRVVTEVTGRRVEIRGLFWLGPNFGSDGNLIASDVNFLRFVRPRPIGVINLGLIRIKPGANAMDVRDRLAAVLPNDVIVLTRQQFIDFEKHHWNTETPIGYMFTLGLLMGMIVGCVIVYQILYTDVSDHLAEYATLKALGYPDRYLFSTVLEESIILSVLGFLPGLVLSEVLYLATAGATLLPVQMTLERAILVYLLTAGMCVFSGSLAMRKLRMADPAEIF